MDVNVVASQPREPHNHVRLQWKHFSLIQILSFFLFSTWIFYMLLLSPLSSPRRHHSCLSSTVRERKGHGRDLPQEERCVGARPGRVFAPPASFSHNADAAPPSLPWRKMSKCPRRVCGWALAGYVRGDACRGAHRQFDRGFNKTRDGSEGGFETETHSLLWGRKCCFLPLHDEESVRYRPSVT